MRFLIFGVCILSLIAYGEQGADTGDHQVVRDLLKKAMPITSDEQFRWASSSKGPHKALFVSFHKGNPDAALLSDYGHCKVKGTVWKVIKSLGVDKFNLLPVTGAIEIFASDDCSNLKIGDSRYQLELQKWHMDYEYSCREIDFNSPYPYPVFWNVQIAGSLIVMGGISFIMWYYGEKGHDVIASIAKNSAHFSNLFVTWVVYDMYFNHLETNMHGHFKVADGMEKRYKKGWNIVSKDGKSFDMYNNFVFFFFHIMISPIWCFTCSIQMSDYMRKTFPKVHKYSGYIFFIVATMSSGSLLWVYPTKRHDLLEGVGCTVFNEYWGTVEMTASTMYFFAGFVTIWSAYTRRIALHKRVICLFVGSGIFVSFARVWLIFMQRPLARMMGYEGTGVWQKVLGLSSPQYFELTNITPLTIIYVCIFWYQLVYDDYWIPRKKSKTVAQPAAVKALEKED